MNSALWGTITARNGCCRRGLIVSFLYVAWALSQPLAASAGPLDSEVDFHISAGSLADALIQFSTQANIQVAVAAHATANLHSPGLTGRLPVAVALGTLLRSSGLSYQAAGDTVTIVQTATRSPPAGPRRQQPDETSATAIQPN